MDMTNLAVWWRARCKNTDQCKITDQEKTASSEALLGYADGNRAITYPAVSLEQAGHTFIGAASGGGKTVVSASLSVQEIRESSNLPPAKRLTLCCIDPKGDLIQGIIEGVAHACPERLVDVHYLNPFQEGFAFNLTKLALGATPVDIRSSQLANLVAVTSTATGVQAHLGTGARQIDALNHGILGSLTTEHPGASPLWSYDAFSVPGGFKQLAALTTSRRAKQFLETAQLSEELRNSCASRLRSALAASENLERIVAAPTCLQFADLFAPGKIVLIDLGRPTGGLVSLQRFYANLFVRLAVEYLLERPSPYRDGHHVRLVVDEAQLVAPVLSDVAEQVLTTGRSRHISLTLITQQTALLNSASDTLLKVLWANCPTKIIGRLSASDATLISREIAPIRGTGESIHALQTKFASAVASLKDREFFWMRPGGIRERFTSATVDLPAWREAADRLGDQIASAKARLALPKDTPPRVTLTEASPARSRNSRKTHSSPAPASEAGAPQPSQPRRSRWG